MERKIYYSFHDMPFSKEDIHPSNYGLGGYPSTSKTEIIHLATSILILSVAFAFSMVGGITGLYYSRDMFRELFYCFIYSLLAILTGFFFHEMSHKFMARKYGLWAEYRMYPAGLMMALLFGILFGFTVAAPGAVNVAGGARRFEIGRVAAAGPLANIIIGASAYLSYTLLNPVEPYGSILGFIGMINIFLAFFNLIPFGPLDGRKIIMWNAIVWAIMFTISLVLIVATINTGIVIPGL